MIEPAAPTDTRRDVVLCCTLAVALAAVQYALQAHVGLAVQDEGFLWYGVEALRRGELPLRDFRSYDPGRYAWCAAWSSVFGGGIVAVRAASAVFQALGLLAGLLVARRVVRSNVVLVLVGVMLAAWMFPPWKLFESAITMLGVWVGVRLLERPSVRRHAAAGVTVGLAAFFGRNHGVYLALGLGAAIVFALVRIERERALSKLATFAGSIVLGYAPMLALIALAPGFARAFVDSIAFYAGQGALNASFAIAWPWRLDTSAMESGQALAAWALSAFFVLVVFGYVLLATAAIGAREEKLAHRRVAIAALCVGLPYVHHMSVRSDVHHVAQAIHPLLLGVVALPFAFAGERARLATALTTVTLCAASLCAMIPNQPAGQRVLARGTPREFVELDVGPDRLAIDARVAHRLNAIRAYVERDVPRDAKLWLSPKLLALYPMLGRRSPVWDVYPVWPADPAREQRMLDELSDVDWAFLDDIQVSGQEELGFARAYPAVYRRLRDEYQRIPTPDLGPTLVFLHRP